MVARLMSWLWRPGLLRTLFSHLHLAGRLLREPRVPIHVKVVPVLAALYVISPLDVVPDVLPIIGEIDDLTLVVIALVVFLKVCPPAAVAFHRGAIAERRPFAPMSTTDDVIDAEWRRE